MAASLLLACQTGLRMHLLLHSTVSQLSANALYTCCRRSHQRSELNSASRWCSSVPAEACVAAQMLTLHFPGRLFGGFEDPERARQLGKRLRHLPAAWCCSSAGAEPVPYTMLQDEGPQLIGRIAQQSPRQ